MKIKKIKALEILDSRGNPTIETTTVLEDGSIGVASVPSGTSTGKYEAVELQVSKAINNVNTKIAEGLIGYDAEDQKEIDLAMIELDGTPNKSVLGANAVLSVSLSVARAQSIAEKKPLYQYLSRFNPRFKGNFILPIPVMNILEGGKHAGWVNDIQEYLILPININTAVEKIMAGTKIYQQLKNVLKLKNYSVSMGEEGGYKPRTSSNSEPFKLISEAIIKAGYEVGEDVYLGIDAAASEFYQNGTYYLKKENKKLTSDELANFYQRILLKYPIAYMEDVFAEDDWESFTKLTALVGNKTQIVGDDLYATNLNRLKKGIEMKATNAVLIKPNQIGTLTETIAVINIADNHKMSCIISHRAGETNDAFIADLAVAMNIPYLKAGAPYQRERMVKYNRLITIENELKNS